MKARAQSYRGLPLGSSSITSAVALVDRDMLTRVSDEMDKLSICEIRKRNLVRLSLFQHNKFVIRCVVYLLRIF
jgi:hypothetical protein